MSSDLRRVRIALCLLFFVPGVQFASWSTRTPDLRDRLGASTAEMGMVLFGLSLGAMTGILSATPLVLRYGARAIACLGMSSCTLGIATVGLGAMAGSPLTVALGLALEGLGMGVIDVALNLEGAEVERRRGRPFLTTMHGFFSFGTVAGALGGLGLGALNLPIHWHLLGIFALTALPLPLALSSLAPGLGRRETAAAVEGVASPARGTVWRDARLYMIGTVVLAMALAEGAANDWLALVMVDGHGLDATSGALVYLGFAAAMTTGRFCGAPVVVRFGRAAVARASALSGAAGIALVIFADGPVVVAAAVALWGLGVSLGFPEAIAAAGESAAPGESRAARIGLVATAGYLAFLVGPPMLGFLGETFGLRSALIVVLALMIVAVAMAPALGGRNPFARRLARG